MAVCRCVPLLVFGVLVAATSLCCANAITYSDVAGFHGHDFSVESAQPYRPTKEHFSKVNAAHQAQFSAVEIPADDRDTSVRHFNKEAHACLAHNQCSEPTPVCLFGRCVNPPQVFRANNDFKQEGAVRPTSADRVNKGFNRGGAVIPTSVNRVNMGFNRGGAVLPGWTL